MSEPVKGLVDMWYNWLYTNDKALDDSLGEETRAKFAALAEDLIAQRYDFIDQIDKEVERKLGDV